MVEPQLTNTKGIIMARQKRHNEAMARNQSHRLFTTRAVSAKDRLTRATMTHDYGDASQ
jgi:hypothetical protein